MIGTTHTFAVDGMHCGSCALLVDDALADVDGVLSSETSVKAARSTVELDVQRCRPDAVVAAIADVGYHARLIE